MLSDLTTRPTLSVQASRLIVDAAVAEARAMSVPVTVVAVDESGVLKELVRMDGAAVASFGTRPGLALIAGGIPVVAAGKVAGAIGVAGAMTAAADRRIAEVALEKAVGG
jgi:uncharacterized protein GlcG (DUF336 family)